MGPPRREEFSSFFEIRGEGRGDTSHETNCIGHVAKEDGWPWWWLEMGTCWEMGTYRAVHRKASGGLGSKPRREREQEYLGLAGEVETGGWSPE